MKKIQIFFILLLFASQGHTQITFPTEVNFHDWQTVKKHQIKTSQISFFRDEEKSFNLEKFYDKQGNNIKTVSADAGGNCIETNFYQFDKNHNKVIWRSHSCMFDLDMDRYLTDSIFYDKKNRPTLIKSYVRTSYEPGIFENSFQDGNEFIYSTNKDTLKVITYNLTYPYGKRQLSSYKFFKYNRKNLIVNYIKINSKNDNIHNMTFEYNSKNKIQKCFESAKYQGENFIGDTPFQGKFIYDKKGRLIRKVSKDSTKSYYDYYDNNLIKQIKEIDTSKAVSKRIFEYEYY